MQAGTIEEEAIVAEAVVVVVVSHDAAIRRYRILSQESSTALWSCWCWKEIRGFGGGLDYCGGFFRWPTPLWKMRSVGISLMEKGRGERTSQNQHE